MVNRFAATDDIVKEHFSSIGEEEEEFITYEVNLWQCLGFLIGGLIRH